MIDAQNASYGALILRVFAVALTGPGAWALTPERAARAA